MNSDFDRLKHDLEIFNQASGLGQPPLGREDVQALGLLGVVGFAVAAWSWLGGGLSSGSLALLATAGSLACVLFYHFKYTRAPKRTVARDRAYRYSWWLATVLSTLLGGFYIWAKFYGGLQGRTFAATVCIFSGALLVLLALTDKWRLCHLGWAVPVLLFGALLLVLPSHLFATLAGATICAGGLASAAIIHLQLKAHATHGKAAD